MASGIDAFALLADEFKSDDVIEQLAAARRIPIVAICMGPERCRSQLVPFLKAALEEYTDEILHAIAKACGSIVPALGGGDYAHMLIPTLEALCGHEETVVRSNAVESLVIVGKAMPATLIQEHFAPVVKRLTSGEFFPSKISAAGLYASIYSSTAHSQRPPLRKQFEQLAKDEMPMVRRAAFAHLPALAAEVEREVLILEIAPIFNELSCDAQESVRELAVENAVKMIKGLSPDEVTKLFGPFIDNLQTESSRSMRVNKAKYFVELSRAMHPVRHIHDQAQHFLRLLALDPELEVRQEASLRIASFCAHLDANTLMANVLPVLRELSHVPNAPQEQELFAINQIVREGICGQVASMAPTLGKEATLNELLPLLKVFFNDEQIEIRRKALGSVAPIVETLGADMTDAHLLPDVLRMAHDTQWRVRLAVVETLPVYAQHLGLDLFNSQLKEIQTAALNDSTARIREAGVQNLRGLASRFGDAWITENILPVMLQAARASSPMSHLGKIMAVQAVGFLAGAMQGPGAVEGLINDIVAPLARDKVAVVRIAAAAALKQIATDRDVASHVRESLRPHLQMLCSDADNDAKILAELALVG